MSPIVFLSVTKSRRRLSAFARRGPPAVVVTLRGEHDLATRPEVAEVVAEAIAVGDVDVVMDLGRVEFMDASTVGVIVWARELLRARGQALTLRAPSPCVRRVLELCDLSDLVDGPAVDLSSARTEAVDTPVATPHRGRPLAI